MRARSMGLVFLIWVVSLLFLQGCASDKRYVKSGSATLPPIKVVRYETPVIMKSTGTETAIIALATLAAPGGSALLVVGDEYAKVRGAGTQAAIPDFGLLVMDKFVSSIKKERPDWPLSSVIQEPLKEEFSEKCIVIEFKVNRIAYGSLDLTRGGIIFERGLDKGMISNGFLSRTTVTMKDSEGEVLWQKSYLYLSDNFDRAMSLDELEANNFDLLKNEMDFAAEKTALDFIGHLNEEPKEIVKGKDSS